MSVGSRDNSGLNAVAPIQADKVTITIAAERIYNAMTNEGSHPEHHERMIKRLREEWPVLSSAIEDMVEAWEETLTS